MNYLSRLRTLIRKAGDVGRMRRLIRAIDRLPIASSGLDDGGVPYVRLEDGLLFYGYPSTSLQRWYRKIASRGSRSVLRDECINVAADIVFRYQGPLDPRRRLAAGKYYDFEEGQRVVEVGAYIGFYAMRAATLVGETGRVIAIEAVDENFALLKKNIRANSLGQILALHKAAWHSPGELDFYRRTRQAASALSEVVSRKGKVTHFSVPCDTVDNMLAEAGIPEVDFVRIQVNGAETEVLQGMTRTLSHRPTLLITAPYTALRESPADVMPLLHDLGYRVSFHRSNIFAHM